MVSLEGIPLKPTDYLEIGQIYTFVFKISRLIEYRSDKWITDQLKYFMQNYGEVIKADTKTIPALWSEMTVTVIPKIRTTVTDWINGFNYSFKNMGYTATFDRVEIGEVSGITERAMGTISEAISSIIKPLTIPLVIIGAVGIIYLLKKSSPFKGIELTPSEGTCRVKKIYFREGIIGALTKEQREKYCKDYIED